MIKACTLLNYCENIHFIFFRTLTLFCKNFIRKYRINIISISPYLPNTSPASTPPQICDLFFRLLHIYVHIYKYMYIHTACGFHLVLLICIYIQGLHNLPRAHPWRRLINPLSSHELPAAPHFMTLKCQLVPLCRTVTKLLQFHVCPFHIQKTYLLVNFLVLCFLQQFLPLFHDVP